MVPGSLHHIELYVSDLTRSIAFWSWLLERLGYKQHQKFDSGQSWILGTTYLVFVQVQDKYKEFAYNRCNVGLNHLAFRAKSSALIDEITQELRNRGVTILYQEKHPHAGGSSHYAVYFEDPDRIKVELIAPD